MTDAMRLAASLADEVESFPLGRCGPSDDPDMQYAYAAAFRDIAVRFTSAVKRIGDPALTQIVPDVSIDTSYITDAHGLRAELLALIDTLRVVMDDPSYSKGTARDGDRDQQMEAREADRRFMQLSIELAKMSVDEDSRVHPKVGVVVVRGGKILAKASRGRGNPGAHAEFIALESDLAHETVAGATVYTTLEPCTTRNHPKVPCAERLIERKVARVSIGMLDPDLRISGKGQRRLREANIETDFFPADLMAAVEELNRDFIRFKNAESQSQVQDNDELEEQRINFIGRWKGQWRNLENSERGEEIIDISAQDGRQLSGSFFDLSDPSITFTFEATYKMSYLRIRYKAPQGQRIMEDGCCFLRLQRDGNFSGYYSNFDGCGVFDLIRIG